MGADVSLGDAIVVGDEDMTVGWAMWSGVCLWIEVGGRMATGMKAMSVCNGERDGAGQCVGSGENDDTEHCGSSVGRSHALAIVTDRLPSSIKSRCATVHH